MKTFATRVFHAQKGRLLEESATILVQCQVPWGQIGIMAGHVPWAGLLYPGVLQVRTRSGVHEFFVQGGIIRVDEKRQVCCLIGEDEEHGETEKA